MDLLSQEQALLMMKSGRNCFLSGPAGVGKTKTLLDFLAWCEEEGIPVAKTASTGIASTHLSGMTIHSWAGIGINEDMSDGEIAKVASRRKVRARMQAAQVLVIDEVSMLHRHVLDLADRVCRAARYDERPFGGLQVVMCGDFYQLPPVVRGQGEVEFVYNSPAWSELDPAILYLTKQYRQGDDKLGRVLNAIRDGAQLDKVWAILKSRIGAEIESGVEPTRLHTHNVNVDQINNKALSRLPGEAKVYNMQGRGEPTEVEKLIRNCLAPQKLVLKDGALVMFVRNDPEGFYVNGTLGQVVGTNDSGWPKIAVKGGRIITAMPVTWAVEEHDAEVAAITQVPLRHAWAITVHKSQGMTLDAVEADLSKAFVPGLGYVALSRARSLKDLRLLGINEMAIEVSEEAKAIDQELRSKAEEILIEVSEDKELLELEAERYAKTFGTRF